LQHLPVSLRVPLAVREAWADTGASGVAWSALWLTSSITASGSAASVRPEACLEAAVQDAYMQGSKIVFARCNKWYVSRGLCAGQRHACAGTAKLCLRAKHFRCLHSWLMMVWPMPSCLNLCAESQSESAGAHESTTGGELGAHVHHSALAALRRAANGQLLQLQDRMT
jgi:hypothetical protein